MIILPAIDIKGGQCVRLYQGDFDTAEKVADSALETARAFEAAGARWLHMVDLDGALHGMALNAGIFLEIVRHTGLKVELGGGIRTLEQIRFYLDAGVERVILGSIALSNPGFVHSAVASYGPERIVVGIDAKGGLVHGSGWTEASDIHYLELAEKMQGAGVETIIYTDISRDGTMTGPSIAGLKALQEVVPEMNLIASGGIRHAEDIRALNELGIYGAICGKSIYEGSLDLKAALAIARGEQP